METTDNVTRRTHTQGDARDVMYLIKATGLDRDARIIGSLGRGAETSEKDIDILLPNCSLTRELLDALDGLFECERAEMTDWGGIFLHNTLFGNLDFFFTTEDFDY